MIKNSDMGQGTSNQRFGDKEQEIVVSNCSEMCYDMLANYKSCPSSPVPRPLLFFVFIFFIAASVFGQTQQLSRQQERQPWWLTLEQGKLKFRSGDYGSALMQFEDARRQRREQFEQMERDLIHLLSQREVRRIGDSLDRVEQYAKDKYYTAAVSALNELYYRVPKNSLNNSAQKALAELGKLKDYPEAEYWIGEVYRVEGEYPLAITQYRKALEKRDLLEDPAFASVLQYKLGGALLIKQDYNEMERAFLSIIEENDTLWKNARSASSSYAQANASFTTNAMNDILIKEGIGRFLEMFRYNNAAVEPAHRQLGFFYAATNRETALQHLMYAFLIQNTIIIEETTKRKFDFTLADPNPPRRPLPSARELLLISEEINRNQTLASFAEETEYYKTAYYLGLSLYRVNRENSRNIANTIWQFLSEQSRAGEWQNRAIQQLRGFRDEPLIERP